MYLYMYPHIFLIGLDLKVTTTYGKESSLSSSHLVRRVETAIIKKKKNYRLLI